MSKENFETLKGTIEAIDPADTKIPNMPVETFLQEASDLESWSKTDQSQLEAAGVPTAYFDELGTRIGALRYAESEWTDEQFSKEEAQQKWEEEEPKAYDLKNQIEHSFRYAFRKRPDLLRKVQAVEEGNSNADLIQDLSDLASLGKSNLPLLKAINFDEAKLDKAANDATDLSRLLAKANGERITDNGLKIMRDKAYTYVKELVDELYEAGKYVFWKDEERKKGYKSNYRR